MAIQDRFGSIIIHDPSLRDDAWVAVDEIPQMASGGWDSLKITYYKLSETELKIEDAMLDFPTGMKLENRKFWLTGLDGPTCVVDGMYRVEATFKGIAADKPVVVSYGASAEQQSAEDVAVGFITYPKIVNHENAVTATARYVIEDLSQAPTDLVGSSQTPVNAPGVGDSFWISLADPVTHFPNGWVLMGSNSEPLPGTTVAFITDSFQFIRYQTP